MSNYKSPTKEELEKFSKRFMKRVRHDNFSKNRPIFYAKEYDDGWYLTQENPDGTIEKIRKLDIKFVIPEKRIYRIPDEE